MITNYMSKKMLEKALGNVDYNIENFQIGLSSTPISKEGTGVTEPSGKGYQRKQVANNTSEWSIDPTNAIKNNKEIRMNKTTEDVGNITWVFISDLDNNILFAQELDRVLNLEQATIVTFEPGDLQFTLS